MKSRVDRHALIVGLLANAGMFNSVKLPGSRSVKWTTPHQGAREKARRRRQIERGIIAPDQVRADQ